MRCGINALVGEEAVEDAAVRGRERVAIPRILVVVPFDTAAAFAGRRRSAHATFDSNREQVIAISFHSQINAILGFSP